MLDDISRERHGVIEAQSLIGLAVVFGGFDDFVDLFFGIATSLGEENFLAIDKRGLDA